MVFSVIRITEKSSAHVVSWYKWNDSSENIFNTYKLCLNQVLIGYIEITIKNEEKFIFREMVSNTHSYPHEIRIIKMLNPINITYKSRFVSIALSRKSTSTGIWWTKHALILFILIGVLNGTIKRRTARTSVFLFLLNSPLGLSFSIV